MFRGGANAGPSPVSRAIGFMCLALFMSPGVSALILDVAGGYGFVIDETDLTGGAGSDLKAVHESGEDAVLLDISDTSGDADAWQIQVHREDILWESGLILSLLRSDTGSGTGSISGGDTLAVDLTDTDQVFFEGSGDRTDIPVQLILSGVSVLIPVESYATTIYFTVVDMP